VLFFDCRKCIYFHLINKTSCSPRTSRLNEYQGFEASHFSIAPRINLSCMGGKIISQSFHVGVIIYFPLYYPTMAWQAVSLEMAREEMGEVHPG